MKVKKLLILSAITACLTINFVACSSDKNMTDTNDTTATDSVDENTENLKDDIVDGTKDFKDDIMDSTDSDATTDDNGDDEKNDGTMNKNAAGNN